MSSTKVAVALLEGGRLKTAAVAIGPNPVMRLANAAEAGEVWAGSQTIVVPEWPMGPSRYAQSLLDRVLGAFLSGCTYARHVHYQGLTPSEWKKASVGHGHASKADIAAWAAATYGVDTSDQDICDAIGIAHAGAAWWASRKETAA